MSASRRRNRAAASFHCFFCVAATARPKSSSWGSTRGVAGAVGVRLAAAVFVAERFVAGIWEVAGI